MQTSSSDPRFGCEVRAQKAREHLRTTAAQRGEDGASQHIQPKATNFTSAMNSMRAQGSYSEYRVLSRPDPLQGQLGGFWGVANARRESRDLATTADLRLGWWLGNPGLAGDRIGKFERVFKQVLARCRGRLAYSMSGCSEAASKSRLKTSAFTQSRYRLKTVFQGPNSGGRSRHGLPVRAIHNTASTKRRLSSPLRPGSDFFPRQCGCIFAHWASLSTYRSIPSLNHNILLGGIWRLL